MSRSGLSFPVRSLRVTSTMMGDCNNDLDRFFSGAGQEFRVDYHNFVKEPLPAFDEPLTPPQSHSPSPDTVVSVSTAFYPGSHALDFDIVFSSSDSVLFYVHSRTLHARSKDAFDAFLPSHLLPNDASETSIIPIPEPSIILDVIFHIMYDMPCSAHAPAFSTVAAAIDRMPVYSICPRDHITPSNPSYSYILSFAPLAPLDLYALAAHHDLQELAVAASSHLLSLALSTIDDATATRIGAVYLRRLLCLHITRLSALKDLLLAPPHPHPPTKDCDFEKQKRLTRAWALVAAYLAWEARPAHHRLGMKSATHYSAMNRLI
ncbi:putative expressed protein [Lyophyllum shimeji]|uniref:Expressed protein n=1 Tax=Lyophyllum shimeji TaxID=47721 RepID=A0A9P3PUB7_LYOSH|nr:putative expressed protein [Lyophyllum shimeji]